MTSMCDPDSDHPKAAEAVESSVAAGSCSVARARSDSGTGKTHGAADIMLSHSDTDMSSDAVQWGG